MYEPHRRHPAFREPDGPGFIPMVWVMLLGNEFCVRVARDDSKRVPDVGDVHNNAKSSSSVTGIELRMGGSPTNLGHLTRQRVELVVELSIELQECPPQCVWYNLLLLPHLVRFLQLEKLLIEERREVVVQVFRQDIVARRSLREPKHSKECLILPPSELGYDEIEWRQVSVSPNCVGHGV
jgi:hypothetical protein